MLIKSFVFYSLLAGSSAWLAPERCAQQSKNKQRREVPPSGRTRQVRAVPDVADIARKQHQTLIDTYKDHKFFGVPIRVTDETPPFNSLIPLEFEIHAPYNCTFVTHEPRMLSSVACSNAGCKLTHTVVTLDTYSASEGYNWGAKVSSKLSLADKLFEVGGEVSAGGTYSCTYNKGRQTTDSVECTTPAGQSGHLQLYTVRSDLSCSFGSIKLTEDKRREFGIGVFFSQDSIDVSDLPQAFTTEEIAELNDSKQVYFSRRAAFMLDTDKISNNLFQKFMEKFPLFNPYTDLIYISPNILRVMYFKQSEAVKEYTHVLPFTNKHGDSVYQYACLTTPY